MGDTFMKNYAAIVVAGLVIVSNAFGEAIPVGDSVLKTALEKAW